MIGRPTRLSHVDGAILAAGHGYGFVHGDLLLTGVGDDARAQGVG